jgi:hypothetical protein
MLTSNSNCRPLRLRVRIMPILELRIGTGRWSQHQHKKKMADNYEYAGKPIRNRFSSYRYYIAVRLLFLLTDPASSCDVTRFCAPGRPRLSVGSRPIRSSDRNSLSHSELISSSKVHLNDQIHTPSDNDVRHGTTVGEQTVCSFVAIS